MRFVHVTDTHIMAGGDWRPRGETFAFDTNASLRRVVDAIRELEPAPAFAVFGGDLASPDLLDRSDRLSARDYEQSYRLFAEILGPLPCRAHFLMGNHDNRIAFKRVFVPDEVSDDRAHCYSFDHEGHHFVALDSLEPGQGGGVIGATQLTWLEHDLLRHGSEPTVLFVHHHPWPLGIPWLDTMGLRNGEELMVALTNHPQVSWVICGHVHLNQTVQRGQLTMLTTPSTCVQASEVSPTRKLLPGPPAFRVVDVAGGQFSTRVLQLH